MKQYTIRHKDGTIKKVFENELSEYGLVPEAKSGIKIKPSKKGTFKAQATKMDMGVQEAASKILNAPEGKYSPEMRKKANFAKNFAKQDGGEIEYDEEELYYPYMEEEYMKSGGMIKRADGSYSKRGLWDNIRDNKGSGKKPTKAMLKQEKKIRAAEKAYGGYMENGGGIDNPGFNALPYYVQQNIIDNMAMGGYIPKAKYSFTPRDEGQEPNVIDLYEPPQSYIQGMNNIRPQQESMTIPTLSELQPNLQINKDKYENNKPLNLVSSNKNNIDNKMGRFNRLPVSFNTLGSNNPYFAQIPDNLNQMVAGATRSYMHNKKGIDLYGMPYGNQFDSFINTNVSNKANNWYDLKGNLPKAELGTNVWSNNPLGIQRDESYKQAPIVQNQYSVDPNQGQQMIQDNTFDNMGSEIKKNNFDAFGLASGLETGLGAFNVGKNATKGFLYDFEKSLETQNARKQMAERIPQSIHYRAEDPFYTGRPESFQGNQPLISQNGAEVRQFGGDGEANVLIENKEKAIHPSGYSETFYGDDHEDPSGGIPLSAEAGTKILSEHLKLSVKDLIDLKEQLPMAQNGMQMEDKSQQAPIVFDFLKSVKLPKTGKVSYADLARNFETKKDFDMLNAKHADDIQKNTAQMLITFKDDKNNQIFEFQQQNKKDGVHGINPMIETFEQENMEQNPMAKYGKELPKAQLGKVTTYSGGKTPKGKTTPISKEFNAFNYPGGINQYYKDWQNSGLDISKLDPESAIQTATYKELLKTLEGRNEIRNMWKKGNTSLGLKKGIGKDFDFNNLTDVQLQELLPAYADNFLGIRSLKPLIKTSVQPTTNLQANPQIEYRDRDVIKYMDKKPEIYAPNMNLAFAGRMPLGEEYINWESIEKSPVYARLITPDLNPETRAARAALTGIGNSGSDRALRAKIAANTASSLNSENQRAFLENRNAKTRANEINAQNDYQVQAFNQTSKVRDLYNPDLDMRWNNEMQQRTNVQGDIENMRKANAFYTNRDYINNVYRNLQDLLPEEYLSLINSQNPMFESNKKTVKETDEYGNVIKTRTTTGENKYGGKVAIKLKISGKNKK